LNISVKYHQNRSL